MSAAGTTSILTLLAISALGWSLAGCAGSGGTSPSARVSTDAAAKDPTHTMGGTTSEGYLKFDSDTDRDDHEPGPSSDDIGEMVAAGSRASSTERKAIIPVVRAYFTAAAAGNGTRGCSLLAATLAAGLGAEDVPGHSGNTDSCAVALSQLFKDQHQHFAAEDVSTMVITGVHVRGPAGRVTLGFKATPEGEIVLQREGPVWKIDALADSQLP